MGNNLPHELSTDMTNYTQTLGADESKQNGPPTRRKTSASVDEIRNLYSALQELVPSQAHPPTTSSYRPIPEDTSTTRIKRDIVDTVEDDVPSRRSNPSSEPVFTNRHRSSSPVPLRTQPNIIQRKRSNSCFAISSTPDSLASPSTDFLDVNNERRSSDSSTESQRINEEFSNLIENFDKEKSSPKRSEKIDLRTNTSEVSEDCSSRRRYSGGDMFEVRRQRLKDPKARMRRRSIGGSMLLNAIIESDSSRQDSLANALSIVARKDKLQEIIKNHQGSLEQEMKNRVGDDFDEVDGKAQQQITPKNPELNALISSMNENQDGENSSSVREKDSDVKPQAGVGTEMQNLLEALQGLVVTGEGATPPASSQTNSRRTSWVEKSSPKRRESLDELEAFFKIKLDEISEKENDQGGSKCVQSQTNAEKTKSLRNKRMDNSSTKKREVYKNPYRRSSSAEQCTRASSFNIHRSQSTVEFLSPTRMMKTRSLEARRSSIQIEMNRTNHGRSNSTFYHHETPSLNEKKVTARMNNSLSRRRKSDIPIIRQDEVLFESTDNEEARKRALWKEDQKVFAKQVNQRLQDWLERATALSLSTAEHTEDDSASIDTNPESSKEDNVKAKRTKFAVKKAFQGRIRRSKSLHNVLEPEEIQDEKPKSRSPLIERSKKSLLKLQLSRLRIPKSMSMHNVAGMKPKLDKVETKPTESDESNKSLSYDNTKRATIWYDDYDSSPEMIPENKEVDISGENSKVKHLSLRRGSCPTPKNNFVNNSIDSRRISRLPVDLPLFYSPGMKPSNLRMVHKKVENCRQNSIEKENKLLPVCKTSFPVKGEVIKNELFYEEPRTVTQVFPNSLISPPTANELSIPHAKSSRPTTPDEHQFMMFQNCDLPKLSDSNDFESFEDFRDRTKSTESEDSGCPNTSDC